MKNANTVSTQTPRPLLTSLNKKGDINKDGDKPLKDLHNLRSGKVAIEVYASKKLKTKQIME